MNITNWSEFKHWVGSIAPKGADLSTEHIVNMDSKERDVWRKVTSKYSPTVEFHGVISGVKKEKRGGALLQVRAEHDTIRLMISSNKTELLQQLYQLNSTTPVLLKFQGYIHFEYGFVGMVTEISRLNEQIENRVYIQPKRMAPSAKKQVELKPKDQSTSNRPQKQWTEQDSETLVSMVNQNIILRQISHTLGFSNGVVLRKMFDLNLIDEGQYESVKVKLIEMGIYH